MLETSDPWAIPDSKRDTDVPERRLRFRPVQGTEAGGLSPADPALLCGALGLGRGGGHSTTQRYLITDEPRLRRRGMGSRGCSFRGACTRPGLFPAEIAVELRPEDCDQVEGWGLAENCVPGRGNST